MRVYFTKMNENVLSEFCNSVRSALHVLSFHFQYPIGHFRVDLNLVMTARLGAQLFIWKLVFFHMQTKLIFIGKAVQLASPS